MQEAFIFAVSKEVKVNTFKVWYAAAMLLCFISLLEYLPQENDIMSVYSMKPC